MNQSIKSKLEQARPQPGYEFHQAVEDALDRLPPMSENRSSLRRPLMFMGAAAAVLAIALPLGMWRLSAGRPDPPKKPLSEAGARLVAATDAPDGLIGTVEGTWEPSITQDADKRAVPMPTASAPDDAVTMPNANAPDDAVLMPRVIEIHTDESADRAAENAFFEKHFPDGVLADPGIQVDGVTLALRGLRLSDDKQSLMIGVLMYGEGLSHQLVRDHERLGSLHPLEIALDGTRLDDDGTGYPISDQTSEDTGSGSCYYFVAPLGDIAPKDEMTPLRLAFTNNPSVAPLPPLAVMANLLTGEVQFPRDDQQRQQWLDLSYPPVVRALRSIDPSPKHLNIAAPLGERQLILTGFAYDGKQAGFSVILSDPERRDLSIKQLYSYGQSQLTTPIKPSKIMPVDGGYGYVFTLPMDPTPDQFAEQWDRGYLSYLVPLFQLGDDQQLMAVSYYEMGDTYDVQDASRFARPDEILASAFADAYGVASGYAVRYDITLQRWQLPDGLSFEKVTHELGSLDLDVKGMPPGWSAKLRLNNEPLMLLPSVADGDAPALRFFTDQIPGRLPDGSTLSLTLYPPDGGEPIEHPDIRLRIEDATAVVGDIPVHRYPGTGIGQPYEQISADFRYMGVNPHFIGATADVGQMRVTLAEFAGDSTFWTGVLVEGDPDQLPPGALTFEQFRIDGTPTELTTTGAYPKYAGGAGRAYLCIAYNESVDDPIPATQDGQPHRIELDFVLNGKPFTLETSGTFTGTGFVPEGQSAQPALTGDRAEEQAFFAEQFPTGLVDDPGVAVDDMKLAVRGLRLSDDGQSVRLGMLLYGDGLSKNRPIDNAGLNSLLLNEFALNGLRLGNESISSSRLLSDAMDSGICYTYDIPLEGTPIADGESSIRLVCDVGDLKIPLALKANLSTGEVRLPKDEAERWAWFGDSYTSTEQAIHAMGLEPLPVNAEAPLGAYTVRVDSFGYSEAGSALAVVLNAPTSRLLTLKQLYAAGRKQLTEPMRPQSEFAIDGGYAYIFDLPIDFGDNPGADEIFNKYAYVAPMFELGEDLQLISFFIYEMSEGQLKIGVVDDTIFHDATMLYSDLIRANHFAPGYLLSYGDLSVGLLSDIQLRTVEHHIGRIELRTDTLERLDRLSPPTLTLNGEPLLYMPDPDDPGAMKFFTDIMPGQLPEDAEFALSLTLSVDGGSSTEMTTFRLTPGDAAAYAFGTPVECYEGTGIGGKYEQLSAFFRGGGRVPHLIGESKTASGATLTLGELQFYAGSDSGNPTPDVSTLQTGVLLEGSDTPPRLTHVSIDGQPLALSDPDWGAPDTPLYAGQNAMGYAFLREIPGEATAIALADGRMHTVALGFAVGSDAFTFSLDGVFTRDGVFAYENEPIEPQRAAIDRGETSKDIRQIQLRLAELGYYNGTADGDLGPVTTTAIKKFQDAAGLEATGNPDADTLARLFAADAPPRSSTPAPEPTPSFIAQGLSDEWRNILLLGADEHDWSESDVPTGAMLILSLNQETQAIKLTWLDPSTVYRVGGEEDFGEIYTLNKAAIDGGPMSALSVINEKFGMNIREYAMIKPRGLSALVDQVGGAYMDITEADMNAINDSLLRMAKKLDSWEGSQRLTEYGPDIRLSGLQAACYMALPDIEGGSLKRDRQLELIGALIDRARGMDANQLTGLLMGAARNVTLSVDMDFMTGVIRDALAGRRQPGGIQRYRLPAEGTYAVERGAFDENPVLVDVDFAENALRLHRFIYGD